MSDEPMFGSYGWHQRQFRGGDGTGLMILLFIIVFFGVFILAWKLLVLVFRYPKVSLPAITVGVLVALFLSSGAGRSPTPSLVGSASGVQAVPTRASAPTAMPLPPVRSAPLRDIPVDLSTLFLSKVPKGGTLEDEGAYTVTAIADGLQDSDEALRLLNAWGWREAVFQEYGTTAMFTYQSSTHVDRVHIVIHRFDNAEGAAQALIYFSDDRITDDNLEEVESAALGDQARALTGKGVWLNGMYHNVDALYVRSGPLLIRVLGTSPEGDPSAAVHAIARRILAKL